MSKRFLAGMAVAAVAILPFGSVHAHPAPAGCAVAAGQGQSSFTVEDQEYGGLIVAGGSWKVTIVREGVDEPIVFGKDHSTGDVQEYDFEVGDQVACETPDGQGVLFVGNA